LTVFEAASEEADTRPWAIYARLSKAASGDLEKCEYQVELCREHAARQHPPIPLDDALVFTDNSLSAWKKRVRRPAWETMMSLAAAGELGGILVYAVDRFTRRPKDLEALIELADDHGLVIEGPRSGRLDLTTATGRQQARWMALQAVSESDNTSERIKTTLGRKMREGKPMGAGRAWGFEVGGTEQRAEEVAVIREVAARMLAGEPTTEIADDLNARGLTTSRGGPFSARNLTRMMVRPRNGGHVEHNGRIVGTIPGEPILDADTYEALVAAVASRRRGRRPTGRYLLTGLLECSTCHRTMNGGTHKHHAATSRYRTYNCPRDLGGCSRSIRADRVEEIVADYMVKLLSEPATVAKISAHEKALATVRAELRSNVEAIEERRDELEIKWAAEEISQRAYDGAKQVLDRRLAAERDKLTDLAAPVAPLPVDVAADWAEARDDEKRALIARFKVRILIGPHARGAGRFDPSRVRIAHGADGWLADYDPEPFIAANRWTFAATVPDAPHDYLIGSRATDRDEFRRFCRWVNATGTPGSYTFEGRTRRYRYATVGQHTYWVSKVPGDVALNRRRAEGA
jgi:DNA invertase Pin-like site-specific DNA recombinase